MTEALAAWTPRALSLLRIVTGLLIIQHRGSLFKNIFHGFFHGCVCYLVNTLLF